MFLVNNSFNFIWNMIYVYQFFGHQLEQLDRKSYFHNHQFPDHRENVLEQLKLVLVTSAIHINWIDKNNYASSYVVITSFIT